MINYICERKFLSSANFVFTGISQDSFQGVTVLIHPNQLFDGCIIYLLYNELQEFIRLSRFIQNKYVLISGLSDFTVPYYSDYHRIDGTELLRSEMLLAWYALNITHEFPKLHHLPIGIPRCIPFLGSSFDVDKKDEPDFEEYIGWYNISTFTDMEWV